MSVDGLLNVNKPYGLTSTEVVRRLKRSSGVKRVGHGGTLDPMATGVVPVCFGQGTRVVEYLVEGGKEYRGIVQLGTVTDTYDAMGSVVETKDASAVSLEDVTRAVDHFKGVIEQVPPMYSALKVQGKRLYELARAGIEVERKPRSVEVHEIDVIDWSPPAVTLNVECGRGLYMRSLAHDLGSEIGSGGHLKELVRTRSGPFHIADSLDLETAEQMAADGDWSELHAPDTVLSGMSAAIVGSDVEGDIRHGRQLPIEVRLEGSSQDTKYRVYSSDGRFLAIVSADEASGAWRPVKVFSIAGPDVAAK